VIRRSRFRKTAWTYVERCYSKGYYPTTEEIADAAMESENMSPRRIFAMFEAWAKREVLAMMQSKDPDTKLRRNLLELAEDGKRRWHPHRQMSFADLDNSGRFVTRPQADRQARAERVRDIEREVLRAMESELGRAVTTEEAWPRVERALEDAGLR
jgi:hypothetical protein